MYIYLYIYIYIYIYIHTYINDIDSLQESRQAALNVDTKQEDIYQQYSTISW